VRTLGPVVVGSRVRMDRCLLSSAARRSRARPLRAPDALLRPTRGHGARPVRGRSRGRWARSPAPWAATSRPRATSPPRRRSRSGSARLCSSPAHVPAGPAAHRLRPARGPRQRTADARAGRGDRRPGRGNRYAGSRRVSPPCRDQRVAATAELRTAPSRGIASAGPYLRASVTHNSLAMAKVEGSNPFPLFIAFRARPAQAVGTGAGLARC
jgi:hypothetical protein